MWDKLKTALAAVLLIASAAHAASPADPNKVLHLAFEAPEDGFDLARTNSLYTNWIAEGVFESLLTYDYLARPSRLVPNTAEAMPEVSDGGRTFTFHLKKGIYFTPHPAFKGKRRELVAADYAYTIKRHLDPKTRSVQATTWEGKLVGMDEIVDKAKKTGKFDYDAPVAGLETPDRYTLRIRLKEPSYIMLYNLANATAAALAREVVEYYGEDVGRHPVGTGPYMLQEYVPHSKIVLVANPDYRGFVWNFKSSGDPWDEQLIRDMKGKQMPQVGRVEINIIEEEQARWLALDSGQLDYEMLSEPFARQVLDGDKLRPQYLAKGFTLYRYLEPGTRRTYFNFKDPVVGGYTKDKIALRRALAMAWNVNEEIEQVWHGQGVKAQTEVSPGMVGFDPNYRNSIPYDPALANKLLDYFGYKKGKDGYRTLPDGKPMVVKIHSAPKSRDVLRMEIWKRALDRLSIRGEFPVSNFADNLKAAYQCELSMWGLGGVAGIPDGTDSLESYYGPNAYKGNFGCYENKEFDDAYRKALVMPQGPERQALFLKMERIMEADTVQSFEIWQIRNWMIHSWVKGYKKHPIINADWMYLDVEKH